MKAALALLIIVGVAGICQATTYGQACQSSNDPAKDDAACSGVNNNMLCNPSSNTCQCMDKYPGKSDGKTYAANADGTGCTAQ